MSTFTEAIERAGRIAISGHIRPDGDCVGSTLAAYNYIRDNYPEKEVRIYLENFASKFGFLKNSDEVSHKLKDTDGQFDLFISCDASNADRLGDFRQLLERSKESFCIDHHVTNPHFADTNIVMPEASSASEVLFLQLEEAKITPDTATCIYHGIVHDTGVFRYSSTSARTLEIASRLTACEMPDREKCIDSFYSKSFGGIRIWGCVMERARLALDGKCIYSYATWKDLKNCSADTMDTEGVVSEMMNTENAVCSLFLYQTGEREYKASLRSKGNVDVSAIASRFDGGGHANASGCSVSGTVEECLNKIIETIGEYLQ